MIRPWHNAWQPAVIATSLLLAAPGLAVDPSTTVPGPSGFARAVEFQPAEDLPVQTLLVPLDVYRTVVRADLGDLRVFNAEGETVPHAIRTLTASTSALPSTIPLPIFPLYGQPERDVGTVEITVERDPVSGAVTRVHSANTTEEAPIVGYLVALGDRPLNIRSLTLTISPNEPGFITPVDVASSEDLQHWQTIARGSIALLEYQGQRLERRSLDLTGSHHGYLRLHWPCCRRSFELTGVSATLLAEATQPQRQRLRIESTVDPSQAGVFHFDVTGYLPIARVAVLLPQKNTLVRAQLDSSPRPDGPWSTRFDGLLYRVSLRGDEIQGPEVDIDPRRDRYLRLRVGAEGGGLGAGSPTVEVAWTPEQIVLVARGSAPYRVAYGNGDVVPVQLDAANIVALVPGLRLGDLQADSGTVGPPFAVAGDDALRPSRKPIPTKQVILWLTLLLGVAILAVMTVRLARGLK